MARVSFCRECGARLEFVLDCGRHFLRCPQEACERWRLNRRALQLLNAKKRSGSGGLLVPRPRRSVAQLVFHYLDPSGTGFQDALDEAREILVRGAWSAVAFRDAEQWTGIPKAVLRWCLLTANPSSSARASGVVRAHHAPVRRAA